MDRRPVVLPAVPLDHVPRGTGADEEHREATAFHGGVVMSDRDLFVDSAGTTTTISAPTLGHIRYTCNQCGHGWEYGQAACLKCGSLIFDAVEVPPSLIQRVGNKIMGIPAPEKTVVKPADPADVAALYTPGEHRLDHVRARRARPRW
jgi:hypothetical protein